MPGLSRRSMGERIQKGGLAELSDDMVGLGQSKSQLNESRMLSELVLD